MRSITLESPAKLNLYLRILNERSDGYHSLLTLFHRISLCDKIRIQKKKSGFSLKTNIPSLKVDETNLITKAYGLLQKKYPDLGGVSVRLTKKIPIGAGLGGGSSNAAFFMLGMKKLYRLAISKKELLRMGRRLGADVPFFLHEASGAIAWGIGEKTQIVPNKRKLWFLLLISNKGLNTKKVYENTSFSGVRPSLTKEKRTVKILCYFLKNKKEWEAAQLLRNDLESSAIRLKPSIQKTIAKLKSLGAQVVAMSGSGPTVFAVLSHQKQARDLAQVLRKVTTSLQSVICHTS